MLSYIHCLEVRTKLLNKVTNSPSVHVNELRIFSEETNDIDIILIWRTIYFPSQKSTSNIFSEVTLFLPAWPNLHEFLIIECSHVLTILPTDFQQPSDAFNHYIMLSISLFSDLSV